MSAPNIEGRKRKNRRLHIANARIIDPFNNADFHGHLYVQGKNIVACTPEPLADFTADTVMDGAGLTLAPGLIDIQARCREPGFESVATIQSETRASVAYGITTLLCPPDTAPIIDHAAEAELIISRAKKAHVARVYPIGALTHELRGTHITEVHSLKKAGCLALSNADIPMADSHTLYCALQYAANFDMPVILRAHDATLAPDGLVHEGLMGHRLGLPTMAREAELVDMQRQLLLVKKSGARAHMATLSTAESVAYLAAAKADGVSVTGSVALMNLFFTDSHLQGYDSNFLVTPPLRADSDRAALRKGLKQRVIEVVCSDHRPCLASNKNAPFANAEVGASTIDSLLPQMLVLGEELGLSLSDALYPLTAGPKGAFGLPMGSLDVGARADFFLFDPDVRYTLTQDTVRSRGKNNPFIGREARGRVRYTFKSGDIVYDLTSHHH